LLKLTEYSLAPIEDLENSTRLLEQAFYCQDAIPAASPADKSKVFNVDDNDDNSPFNGPLSTTT